MTELHWSTRQSDGFLQEREKLARRIRAVTSIVDDRILSAFLAVPRHLFVPESQKSVAYEDRALPLAEMQTISQPSMIAIMLGALGCEPDDHILEVGAGSGYAAALLGHLVARVDAIELRPKLAARARQTLLAIGASNVHVHVGDGSQGLPERAPFGKILVSAGARGVPAPLLEQLSVGGRIAIPVGNSDSQTLLVGERTQAGSVAWVQSIPCMFVPLFDSSAEGQA
jgi:protein-L-isoaspartate(D-aspartate) O-methyltransferase